jgi:putative endonuclease
LRKSRTKIGQLGEELAREYLKNKRLNIIDTNFRCSLGEIDIVARKSKAFRFVEVKYRRSTEYGLPQDSVVKRKQQRIRNAAIIWLKNRHLPIDSEIHFDVLAITEQRGKTEYKYIEDAF